MTHSCSATFGNFRHNSRELSYLCILTFIFHNLRKTCQTNFDYLSLFSIELK